MFFHEDFILTIGTYPYFYENSQNTGVPYPDRNIFFTIPILLDVQIIGDRGSQNDF